MKSPKKSGQSSKTKNSKPIRIAISLLVFILILFGLIFLVIQQKQSNLKTLIFNPIDLNDQHTKIFFSDENDLYEANLNGAKPKKLASFPRFITSLYLLENGDLTISAEGRYLGTPGEKLEKGWTYESEGEKIYQANWILRNGAKTPENISKEEFGKLFIREKFYTLVLPSGKADIMYQASKDTTPQKIGQLTKKLNFVAPCEGPSIYVHPTEFSASFNKKYLLSNPGGRGGTCISKGSLITSDGTKNYQIDLNSINNVIWIRDDKLLKKTSDLPIQTEVITLKENGTFSTQVLDLDFTNYSFRQEYLSPSRKFLFLYPGKNAQPALYVIENNSIIILEKIPGWPSFQSWNENSDKLVFSSEENITESTNLMLYDLTAKKLSVLAQKPKSKEGPYRVIFAIK